MLKKTPMCYRGFEFRPGSAFGAETKTLVDFTRLPLDSLEQSAITLFQKSYSFLLANDSGSKAAPFNVNCRFTGVGLRMVCMT
jgi:hypothetical protein